MKKYIYFVFIVIFTACNLKTKEKEAIPKQKIIPMPQKIFFLKGELTINKDFVLIAKTEEEKLAASTLNSVLEIYNLKLPIFANSTNTQNIIFNTNIPTIDSLKKEGYKLNIKQKKVIISANTGAGLFYAVQSIRQLIKKTPSGINIPHCIITDWPNYKWRALHLDVCRHFFDTAFIKKYIDNMAKYKLNTFHWHLTDDQGWRIEIKKYPKLCTIGAKRSQTVVGKNFNPYVGDHTPYGGYYTQQEIKEIVEYAQKRYVNIVPEIEMPGHAQAALAAYPEFSCTKKAPKVLTTWGVTDTIYCPSEKTFAFLQDVLDEVMALFPSKYIHIGGDEVPKKLWEKSVFCQNLMRKKNLKNENQLQSYFIKKIEKYLNSKGRNLIAWDEALEGGLAPIATIMSWRGEESGITAANAGHDVIMTPEFVMYFDHYQGNKKTEPLAIGGFTPLKAVYDYNPMSKKIDANKRYHLIGVQANVWTEYMKTPDYVEYMVYPRLLALSEIAWTKPKLKNWNSFKERLHHNLELLKMYHINFRPYEFDE